MALKFVVTSIVARRRDSSGMGRAQAWFALCLLVVSGCEPGYTLSTDAGVDARTEQDASKVDANRVDAAPSRDSAVPMDADGFPDADRLGDASRLDATWLDGAAHDAAAGPDAVVLTDTGVDAETNDEDAGDDDMGPTPITSGECGVSCDCTPDPDAPIWLPRGSIRGDYHQANETLIGRANAALLHDLRPGGGLFPWPAYVAGRHAYTAFAFPFRGSPDPPPSYVMLLVDEQKLCAAAWVREAFTITAGMVVTPLYGGTLQSPMLSNASVDPTWIRTELLPPAQPTYVATSLLPYAGRVTELRQEWPSYGPDTVEGSSSLWAIEPATGEGFLTARFDHACSSSGGLVIDAHTNTAVVTHWGCYADGFGDARLPTGKVFAVSLDSGVATHEWNLDDYDESTFRSLGFPEPMLFAYDNGTETVTRVAIADTTHDIRTFDLTTGEETWSVPRSNASSTVETHISYDGKRVILSRTECTDPSESPCATFASVITWLSPDDGRTLRTRIVNGRVAPVTSTPELTFIVGDKLFVLDNETGELLTSFQQQTPPPANVLAAPAVIAAGRVYVAGGGSSTILGVD